MKSGHESTPEKFDELSKSLLVPLTPELEAAMQVTAIARPRRERLPRADRTFVRIWASDWADSRLYPAHTRLYHVLIHLSREGRKNPVELTATVAEMAKISRWHRSRHARHLERLGLVRIEHHNPGLLILTVLAASIPGRSG
jgi:hypothetical protein